MPAHAIMPIHHTASSRGRWRRCTGRVSAATIAGGGFAAGLAWAFVGSLVLGLGTRATERGTACAWLAVEGVIGAGMLAALLLASPTAPAPR